MIKLHLGDCLDRLREMESDSIDAVVTDPPYGLSAPPDIAVVLQAWLAGEKYTHGSAGFMASEWDSFVPGPRVWREVFRALKPGGHAVVFAGTRTVDLMGIAVRLGGFEVRDMGQWCAWSGFPKSLDLSKEMDRLAGAEREDTGRVLSVTGNRAQGSVAMVASGLGAVGVGPQAHTETLPATDNARTWDGWGTGLKPAVEPWLLLRKPISESSIARNVLRWGTGGINIDACRFAPGDSMWPGPDGKWQKGGDSGPSVALSGGADGSLNNGIAVEHDLGRFPANLVHVPKASRKERELGCEHLPARTGAEAVHREEGSAGMGPRSGAGRTADEVRNYHPTVKPVRLMQWLVRLVTPQSGVVLDPFMGSGTTGVAAVSQGFSFIGMELDPGHLRICRARIEHAAVGKAVGCELEPEPDHVGQLDMWRS